ncbi:MAG: DNA mismatch repair endonuclease MutL [Bacteroidaceae bacterium]|nr:DNA mismatch repair endonuclease MutL [Bacteroidaceae bacterium]
MSDIIQLLPDSVANQIAAGEVIQRPASVIKELVENSIDAGATRIQVVVTDAGKTGIQVIDNGKGMSETDARLSFERHATSKIKTADDLFALNTMGFRGEALASIAAVAQVELRTRMADEELGVSVQIEGSKFMHQEPIATPVGANFNIRNLFYNVPARRKFLKSNATELANINTEFERIALAHPELAFSLSTPDRTIIDLPATNFRQRIVNIFGPKVEKHLLPIQVETSLIKMVGFVGSPESSKKKGCHQYFFVNGRYMRHPYFAKAITNAFERLIPEGEQVHFFLQMVVDPSKIDVNIHPTKTEIKFEDEQAIWQIIRASVREALNKFNAIPTIDFDTEGKPDIPSFNPFQDEPAMPSIAIDNDFNPFATPTTATPRTSSSAARITTSSAMNFDAESDFTPDFSAQDFTSFFQQATQVEPAEDNTLYKDLPTAEQQTWEIATARFMQFQGRYILTATEEGIMLIDQQRAHQRILFEDYMQRFQQASTTQRLLFPQIIDFPLSKIPHIQELESQLTAIGFEISYLGGGSYSIMGVPGGVDAIDPLHLLQSVVDEALLHHTDIEEEMRKTIAYALARKAALPYGKQLSEEEMRALASQLFTLEQHTLTPHGKTIVSVIKTLSIQQLFQ